RCALLQTVVAEPHQQGLDDTDASVIATQPRYAPQFVEVFEYRSVGLGQLDFQARAGVEQDARTEVLDDERNGPSEIAVARVSDEASTCESVRFYHKEDLTKDDPRMRRAATRPIVPGTFRRVYWGPMRVVIQRVSRACVTVDGEITGSIDRGFLILLGV